ncbi:double-CXXCG motif protein [Archangium sp.]|uniref:double-CXXCG motif protein n=1 Tax=Archangium sp. TaxID=1872627 RepID=UPI002D36039B|nr:double-CXXCG motif protein [Archangium sp.]HYO59620.1 double-CXXCG motif protein [Archangium sp.]
MATATTTAPNDDHRSHCDVRLRQEADADQRWHRRRARGGHRAAPLGIVELEAEGLRGLKGCPTALRFRQRNSPELLEMELLSVGRLHPDCLPPNRKPSCLRCGRQGHPPPQRSAAGHLHPSQPPRPVPAGGLLQSHRSGIGWCCLPTLGREEPLLTPGSSRSRQRRCIKIRRMYQNSRATAENKASAAATCEPTG